MAPTGALTPRPSSRRISATATVLLSRPTSIHAGIEGEGSGPITNPIYAVTVAVGEASFSSGIIGGDRVSGGSIVNTGTINSGHNIIGGDFFDGGAIIETKQGEISDQSPTLEDLTFYRDINLTKSNYNIVNSDQFHTDCLWPAFRGWF